MTNFSHSHRIGQRTHDISNAVSFLEVAHCMVQFHLLDNLHPNPKVLNEHGYSVLILLPEWYDDISMFHGRLDEVVISRLHKPVVLGQHFNNCASSFGDITLNSTGQADIIWSKNENFKVHELTESALYDSMDAFKDYNWGSFDSIGDSCALVQSKVIGGNFAILPCNQLTKLFVGQIEV